LIVQHGTVGRTTLVALIALGAVVAGCTAAPAPYRRVAPVQLRAEIVQQIPHDTKAFTEGLELADGVLYEGTGLEGKSTIRAVDPATGAVRQQATLPGGLFGEGITVVGPTIWQLTYREGVAIQRDRATFAELRRASYQGEGWGLCHDANRLVMSDGTDRLTVRDPQTFQPTGEIHVTSGGNPVTRLNELECTPGAVFANIWDTDTIVRIDPATGKVTADIDLAGLLPSADRVGVDVLNGIAAVPGTDEFLVTGKYWPKMFRVRFVRAAT
jgi:glutaminyl-peptide cyclotransferase